MPYVSSEEDSPDSRQINFDKIIARLKRRMQKPKKKVLKNPSFNRSLMSSNTPSATATTTNSTNANIQPNSTSNSVLPQSTSQTSQSLPSNGTNASVTAPTNTPTNTPAPPAGNTEISLASLLNPGLTPSTREQTLISQMSDNDKRIHRECEVMWSRFRISEIKFVLAEFSLSSYGRKQQQLDRLKMYFLTNPNMRARIRDKVQVAYDRMNNPRMSFAMSGPMYRTNLPIPQPQLKPGENVEVEMKLEENPMWETVQVIKQTMFGGYSYGKNPIFIFTFNITAEIKAKLEKASSDAPDHKLVLSCCRAGPVAALSPIQYPRYSNVSISGNYLKISDNNYSGGPPKALSADITQFAKVGDLAVKFNWSSDIQSYVAIAKIIRVIDYKEVLDRIINTSTWTKEKMVSHHFKKSVDDDIIAGTETISLRDPITRSKIKTPLKSQKCSHIQCFDGETFLTMNQNKGKWECPVCNSQVTFTDLIHDGYFDDILKNTNQDCDQVEISADGVWQVPKPRQVIDTVVKNNTNGKRDLIVIDGTPEHKRRKTTEIEIICLDDDSEEEIPLHAIQNDVVLRGKGITLD